MTLPACLLAASTFLAGLAWAQETSLIVVEDRGGDSALPYYQTLRNSNKIPGGASRQIAPPARSTIYQPSERTTPQGEAAMPPLVPRNIRPGTPTRKSAPAPPGATPFFLVGDDPASRAWLKDWHSALREAGATGFVVEAQDVAALERLRNLAPGLFLAPASGDEFAARFGLKTYPVLVVPAPLPGQNVKP
jgi:integrating conjugative element protein (TIGR03765 family)